MTFKRFEEAFVPEGWVVYQSTSTGKKYYMNIYTFRSQWHIPSYSVSYEEYLAYQAVTKIYCSQLLIKHNESRRPSSWREENITRSKAEACEMIQEYHRQILANENTFEELATTYSDCPSAKRNGAIGCLYRRDIKRSFVDIAFALNVGEISLPVDTDSGFHIILRTA